jgi:hypothetical protein
LDASPHAGVTATSFAVQILFVKCPFPADQAAYRR